ncbi:26S proteasome non-ATPase regulatory subunit 4-like [Actinia tenebrosa]|uniref:26S proteasome non-ATPase regulatory subunit 4 n=1 Tax=Actinia tenebrosa TaxID=6105 RepID=A0A6P8I3C8_ACTTE|nr:26S proteasome non-ATPase regulatory subunit 4-like [Actinia tenebrosa]
MVLESTVVCVDNSEWTRNGDFLPTRIQAQQDAVSLICHSKTRQNPENNIGLMTLASLEVLVTLTSDVGKVLTSLHKVQPKGDVHFLTGVKKAHLVLKHRQGKNHKMRIVVFVGSPIESEEKEIVKLAKKLKKEKVNVDIINFGEEEANTERLTAFINVLNGKDGNLSRLVSIPPGPSLSDALISSPVVVGEDGAGAMDIGSGFEFGVDPNADPELALALRVSMEEQRQRQEDEARRTAGASQETAEAPGQVADKEEAMLQQAMSMSGTPETVTDTPTPNVNFSTMSEEEQIEYAMQLSLQNVQEGDEESTTDSRPDTGNRSESQQSGAVAMETETQGDDSNQDFSQVMADPDFLQRVLSTLPGVDPSSATIQNVMGTLTHSDKPQDENMEESKVDKKSDKK